MNEDTPRSDVPHELLQAVTNYLSRGGRASTPAFQREFSLSYGPSARLMDCLEAQGVVGPAEGNGPRDVLILQVPKMNVYLDIDGTLIHEDAERAGKPAEGLVEFFDAIRPYDVYWLTTHCMDGNPEYARAILYASLPDSYRSQIDQIRPTTWKEFKTEAIDYSKPFMWFENDVYEEERLSLRQYALMDRQWLAEVDLVANPRRLGEIIRTYLYDNNGQV